MNRIKLIAGRSKQIAVRMADVFVKQRVTRSAAAMSYYITMSVFPLLIVIYAILSSLHISNEGLYQKWEQIIPTDVLNVILSYLHYVGGNKSTLMIVVGVAVTLTSSASMFGTLMKIMADIQGKSHFKGITGAVYNFAVSIGLIAVFYISALVIVSGEWLLNFLCNNFGFSNLLELWQWVRFSILFLLMLFIIYLVYIVSAPKERKMIRRMPGALIASALLVAVSTIFSRLIGTAFNYPIVYGSLASFIILMFWIYLCSIILIMGNVFNYIVFHKETEIKKFGESA